MKAGIALGTNIEPREAHIREAWERLAALSTEPMLKSPIYETAPVDCPPGSPAFLNGVVEITTDLDPHKLFTKLQQAEVEMGRPSEHARNSPRTIDLDLLYWEGGAVEEPGLTVPHPGLCDRAFALAPLLDVAPELEASLGARLAALEPAAPIGWTETPSRGRNIEVRAIDDADALALALGAALGGARDPVEVRPIEAMSPTELVQAAWRQAGTRPAAVVLEALSPRAIRARLVLDPPANHAFSEPSLARLGDGICAIATGGPNLL